MVNKEEEIVDEEVIEEEQEINDPDEPQEESVSDNEPAEPEEPSDSPDEDLEAQTKAQEAYRDRQKQKREDRQRQADLQAQASQAVDLTKGDQPESNEIEQLKQFLAEQQYNKSIAAAEVELTGLEKEFVVAFPDYTDEVEQAISASKQRMVMNGMTESQADAQLKREKVLLADKAAANGLDPVEAVYNEAKKINAWVDSIAESRGYTRTSKPQTNLNAQRKISKPNAITGGTGKGATAAKKSLDDMDSMEDLEGLTVGHFMRGEV